MIRPCSSAPRKVCEGSLKHGSSVCLAPLRGQAIEKLSETVAWRASFMEAIRWEEIKDEIDKRIL